MNLQDIKKKAQELDELGVRTYLADPKEILWLVGEIERLSPKPCVCIGKPSMPTERGTCLVHPDR